MPRPQNGWPFIVGCGRVSTYEWEGERIVGLGSIVTDRLYRGWGIGSRLVDHGKTIACQKGHDDLYALVDKTDPLLIEFYENNGFEFVDGRPIPKIKRDCEACPLYENLCKEATYAVKLVVPQPEILVPGSYRSSLNVSAHSGLPEMRAVQ